MFIEGTCRHYTLIDLTHLGVCRGGGGQQAKTLWSERRLEECDPGPVLQTCIAVC